MKLTPRPVRRDDLAREPGPLAVFGRALPRQREHGPTNKVVDRFPRRAGGVALGVLLEGLADAGEGDGGHLSLFCYWLGWLVRGVGARAEIKSRERWCC